MAKLFEPYTIRGVEFKNRIVMAPMCMYSSHHDDGWLKTGIKFIMQHVLLGKSDLLSLKQQQSNQKAESLHKI